MKRTKENIIAECRRFWCGAKSWFLYEDYKRKIAALNLPAEEYEKAVREIARIVGV